MLAPSQFPGGGYAAEIESAHGERHIYVIYRDVGRSEGSPEFGDQHMLEYLALHEWGHCFSDHAIEPYIDAPELTQLYQPVAKRMSQQAYGSVEAFFCEQVLRAVDALAKLQKRASSFIDVKASLIGEMIKKQL